MDVAPGYAGRGVFLRIFPAIGFSDSLPDFQYAVYHLLQAVVPGFAFFTIAPLAVADTDYGERADLRLAGVVRSHTGTRDDDLRAGSHGYRCRRHYRDAGGERGLPGCLYAGE